MTDASKNVDFFTRPQQIIMFAVILIAGISLFVATSALVVMVMKNTEEIKKNREIACQSRYLSGDQYAPACQQYVDKIAEVE